MRIGRHFVSGPSYIRYPSIAIKTLFAKKNSEEMFQTHDNREHLAMMERVLGPLPQRMVARSQLKYFSHGRLDWDETSTNGRYVRKNCRPLRRYIPREARGLEGWDEMFDLINKMLIYEPSKRLTLSESLRHSIFADMKNQAYSRSSDSSISR